MIVFDKVTKAYEDNNLAVIDLSLKIEDGEFVFIVGDSGSGKSTFLRLLLRELKPTSGTISVDGQDISLIKRRKLPFYRRNIGVVFQDFRLLPDRNVYENVALAQRVIATHSRVIGENVTNALSNVGLSAKYKSFPQNLSGGEQQRVAIARALVNRPKILLADEPTGNLDPTNSLEIMRLLDEANQRGTTVIVVTHDLELVEHMKKRVITLRKGVMIADENEFVRSVPADMFGDSFAEEVYEDEEFDEDDFEEDSMILFENPEADADTSEEEPESEAETETGTDTLKEEPESEADVVTDTPEEESESETEAEIGTDTPEEEPENEAEAETGTDTPEEEPVNEPKAETDVPEEESVSEPEDAEKEV